MSEVMARARKIHVDKPRVTIKLETKFHSYVVTLLLTILFYFHELGIIHLLQIFFLIMISNYPRKS